MIDWRTILDGLRPYAPMPAFLLILVVSNFSIWVLALWTARKHFRDHLPELTRELLQDRDKQIEQLEAKKQAMEQEKEDYRVRFRQGEERVKELAAENKALELENKDHWVRLRMAMKALQLSPRLEPVKQRKTG